ncbi:MAG: hypothetical protein ACR2P1_19470 [Pseudomonadales bacterium]
MNGSVQGALYPDQCLASGFKFEAANETTGVFDALEFIRYKRRLWLQPVSQNFREESYQKNWSR